MVLGVENGVARKDRVEPIDVVSTKAALGAEVRGLDLRALNGSQFAALERAWHDHQVILVRGQTLLEARAAPVLLAAATQRPPVRAANRDSRGALLRLRQLTLEGAAGVGRLEAVKRFFNKGGSLKANATKASATDDEVVRRSTPFEVG